jgi:uncharacterized protein YndB with AHSA1/START domain
MTTPEFTTTRRFAAPIDRVWAAWTERALLERWFGPKGCRFAIDTFDCAPGGAMLGTMTMADGTAMRPRFAYRTVEPQAQLAWEHGFADANGDWTPPPFPGPFPLRLLTTVTFEPAGEATQVTVRWTPIEATPEEEAAFAAMMASFETGWGGSFEMLDAMLAA